MKVPVNNSSWSVGPAATAATAAANTTTTPPLLPLALHDGRGDAWRAVHSALPPKTKA